MCTHKYLNSKAAKLLTILRILAITVIWLLPRRLLANELQRTTFTMEKISAFYF